VAFTAHRLRRAHAGLAMPIGPAALSLGLAPVPAAAAQAPNAPPRSASMVRESSSARS
jgi:hypothetical protein